MFHMHSEGPDSPLNKGQAEEFNAFCKALVKYRVNDTCRFYYADPDSFSDRQIPLEWLICDLQETLNAIKRPILEIIARLEKTQPLKLQLQESLMVLAKVFFQLKWEKQWAMDYHNIVFSQEQKEILNKRHDAWMSEQIGRYFSNVQTFANKYLLDIEHIEDFTRFIRDFFPRPEEYEQLFTVFRQERSEIFWDKNRYELQERLYNLLISAFTVQSSPVAAPQLPPSVLQAPVVLPVRNIMPPPLARPKQREIYHPSTAKPMAPPRRIPLVSVPELPEKPRAAGEHASVQPKTAHVDTVVRVPLQPVCDLALPAWQPYWAYQSGTRPQPIVLAPESPEKPRTACADRGDQRLPLQPVCALALPARQPYWAYQSGTRPQPIVLAPESPEKPRTAGLEEEPRTPSQGVKRQLSQPPRPRKRYKGSF